MEKEIRNLREDEIECRIGTISEKGISLLLYKDARVDQNILDETFGVMGWTRTHQKIGDALYCTVSVKDQTGEWISKQDVGTESYSDAVKGAASDSFKRACVNFGIGRALYTAPFIWIPADKTDISNDGKRYICKDHFVVSEIQYDEKNTICKLSLKNQKGREVYVFCKNDVASKKCLSELQEKKLKKEMLRTGVTEQEIMNRYHIDELLTMTKETYDRVLSALEKTKDLVA